MSPLSLPFCVLLGGLATPVDSVLTLPAVEVREARPALDRELRLAPGFARAYDVSQVHGRLRMVSDVLAGGAGLHVRQYGGLGAFSAVSIRGSSPAQVAVYLDGVPLNQAQYGVVNAADLPIEALDRIEVYRGSTPLGLQSLGAGVIHLVSRRDEGTWASATAGTGSFGTGQSTAAAGLRHAATRLLVVSQYMESAGDFEYLDDNDTPTQSDDDTLRLRRNNRFESWNLTARAARELGAFGVAFTHDRLTKLHGSPGTGANPALHARLRTDRDASSLVVGGRVPGETRFGSSNGAIRAQIPSLRVYAVRARDRFDDPQRELTGARQDTDDRTVRFGAQLDAAVELPAAQRLSLMTEGRRERYTPRVNVPEPRILPSSNRRFVAIGAEHRLALAGGRAGIAATLRREGTFDDFPSGPPYPGALPAPAVARTIRHTRWNVGARVDVAGGVALKADVSREARAPTLEELFGSRGGVVGNPAARPERIDTRDAGLVGFWTFGTSWIEAQASAYRSDARDLLVFLPSTTRSSVALNISAARLEGIESSVRSGWDLAGWARLSADMSWTRQWTRDQGQVAYWRGKELPGRPRDEVAARIGLADRRASLFYELHALSSQALDRYNQRRIPGRSLHDLGVSARAGTAGLEITAECRNLTDRRVEDYAGYPLPGRSFFVSARIRLERKAGTP